MGMALLVKAHGFDARVLALVRHHVKLRIVQHHRVDFDQLELAIGGLEVSQRRSQQLVEFLKASAVLALQVELQEEDAQLVKQERARADPLGVAQNFFHFSTKALAVQQSSFCELLCEQLERRDDVRLILLVVGPKESGVAALDQLIY